MSLHFLKVLIEKCIIQMLQLQKFFKNRYLIKNTIFKINLVIKET